MNAAAGAGVCVCVCQYMSISTCVVVCINWSAKHFGAGFSPQKPYTKAVLQLDNTECVCECVCVSGALGRIISTIFSSFTLQTDSHLF